MNNSEVYAQNSMLVPEVLYKANYELRDLTQEELVEAHNELIDFLQNLQTDIYNQIDLVNRVRVEKLGLEDELVVTRIPRNIGG
mgnify:CR=1 FL=1